MLLDGKRVASASESPGASIVYLTFEQPIQAGRHVVAVQIVRQSVNPSTYMVIGGVVAVRLGSNASQTFRFTDTQSVLRTGDAINLTIDIAL